MHTVLHIAIGVRALLLILSPFSAACSNYCNSWSKARLFPSVPIYGGSHQSPALTRLVKGDDQFTIGKTLNVKSIFSSSLTSKGPSLTQLGPGLLLPTRCLATPCHTQDSICYYVTNTSKSAGGGGGG